MHSLMHYVIKVTQHYLVLHRFYIHSALELSRTLYNAAASRLREVARWQLYRKFLKGHIFCGRYIMNTLATATTYSFAQGYENCKN